MITSAGDPPARAAATTPVAPIPPSFTAPVVTSPPRQRRPGGRGTRAGHRCRPDRHSRRTQPPRPQPSRARPARGATGRGRAPTPAAAPSATAGPSSRVTGSPRWLVRGPGGCPAGRPAAQRGVAGAGHDRGGARGHRPPGRAAVLRRLMTSPPWPPRRGDWPGTVCTLADGVATGVGAGLGPGAAAVESGAVAAADPPQLLVQRLGDHDLPDRVVGVIDAGQVACRGRPPASRRSRCPDPIPSPTRPRPCPAGQVQLLRQRDQPLAGRGSEPLVDGGLSGSHHDSKRGTGVGVPTDGQETPGPESAQQRRAGAVPLPRYRLPGAVLGQDGARDDLARLGHRAAVQGRPGRRELLRELGELLLGGRAGVEEPVLELDMAADGGVRLRSAPG